MTTKKTSHKKPANPEPVLIRETENTNGAMTNYLDQKYLNPKALKEETLNTLAGLELQKHRYRLILVASGPETRAENGALVGDEITRLDHVIQTLESEFADVLRIEN